jgi:hypothetical protein
MSASLFTTDSVYVSLIIHYYPTGLCGLWVWASCSCVLCLCSLSLYVFPLFVVVVVCACNIERACVVDLFLFSFEHIGSTHSVLHTDTGGGEGQLQIPACPSFEKTKPLVAGAPCSAGR